jgi:hypothetical protein
MPVRLDISTPSTWQKASKHRSSGPCAHFIFFFERETGGVAPFCDFISIEKKEFKYKSQIEKKKQKQATGTEMSSMTEYYEK